MPRTFADTHSGAFRALQIYLILIGRAANQQTVRYRQLNEIMEYGEAGSILSWPLGAIMRWCQHEGLPALTSIVIEKDSGLPSVGLTVVVNNDFPREQQRVFDFPGIPSSPRPYRN